MLIVALLLSLLMGATLGLLGGGGSILTVPLLVYVVGMPAHEAIAASLLVVGVTSIAGTVLHARAGNVCWKTGAIFGAFAMAGAYGGGFAARFFSDTTLLMMFALLMAVTGIAMGRGRRARKPAPQPEGQRRIRVGHVAIEGLIVGGVTGLVGAGGGFLVVPALVMFGGLGMRKAVGTSLLVIAIKSFASLAGHMTHVAVDLPLALTIAGVAVAGVFVGTRLARRISPDRLRCVFAAFVLVMAGVTITSELWSAGPAGVMALVFGVGWLALAAMAIRLVRRCSLLAGATT